MPSRLITALALFMFASLARAAFDGGGSQAYAATAWESVKVEYRIHETPGNPATPVAFTITMILDRVSTTGNQVAWHAGHIQFRKKGTGGASDIVWNAYDVDAETTDGYWRITHANASAPLTSEFLLPPQFVGVASAVIGANGELDFDFRGRAYTPPQGGAPYDKTGGMTYDLDCAVGPDIPGSDQPVEVPPIDDPNGTA